MPRVTHVKKARKAIERYGKILVNVGDPYYWWKFRYGLKQVSKTYPRPSQLTQSAFYQTLYELQEQTWEVAGDMEEQVQEFTSQIEELRDQCEESRENMPESLQESPVAELLQERYDALDEWIEELSSVDLDQKADDVIEELESISCDV